MMNYIYVIIMLAGMIGILIVLLLINNKYEKLLEGIERTNKLISEILKEAER